jgi:hypothetical protein
MGYVIGLDLGKQSDPTALSVVSAEGHNHARLDLVHLERYPLGTPYTSVANRVAALVRDPRLLSPELVVDAGGVGGAVADILAAEGILFVPVTLTGGQKARYEGGSWRVPKPELVAALDVALTTRRLKVAQGLLLWPALREELLAFRRKIDLKTAHVCFEHHTASGHGELVIATALAVWKAGNTG